MKFLKDLLILLNLHFLFAHELLDVASGTRHSLLLFDNGKILPFGDNGHGQLGLSKNIDYQYAKLAKITETSSCKTQISKFDTK